MSMAYLKLMEAPFAHGVSERVQLDKGQMLSLMFIHIKGTYTTTAAWVAGDTYNTYPSQLIEQVKLQTSLGTPIQDLGFQVALANRYFGWKYFTDGVYPAAASTAYPVELVLPIRINPYELFGVSDKGRLHDMDLRTVSNAYLDVVQGAAGCLGANGAFAGTMRVMQGYDLVSDSAPPASIGQWLWWRNTIFQQHAIAGTGVFSIRLQQAGYMRGILISTRDAAGHLVDGIIGNITLRTSKGAVVFEGDWPLLASMTRSRMPADIAISGFAFLDIDLEGLLDIDDYPETKTQDVVLKLQAIVAAGNVVVSPYMHEPAGQG